MVYERALVFTVLTSSFSFTELSISFTEVEPNLFYLIHEKIQLTVYNYYTILFASKQYNINWNVYVAKQNDAAVKKSYLQNNQNLTAVKPCTLIGCLYL